MSNPKKLTPTDLGFDDDEQSREALLLAQGQLADFRISAIWTREFAESFLRENMRERLMPGSAALQLRSAAKRMEGGS